MVGRTPGPGLAVPQKWRKDRKCSTQQLHPRALRTLKVWQRDEMELGPLTLGRTRSRCFFLPPSGALLAGASDPEGVPGVFGDFRFPHRAADAT